MRITIIFLALIVSLSMYGQQTGYYNGVDGKDGDELKSELHNIIKDHTSYSYYSSKFVLELSDADPMDPNNVIQVYTGFSHDNSDYGNGGLQLNREHVWAKSHGGFADWYPMYSDVHNLKPSASSVNQDKSNLDFDNGGNQHDIATGCYSTDSTWEARDEVKGDIARIIFYMATRYEGGAGEIDLEVADNNHTYPQALHGKLSTLLAWNLQDPPDDFERNRNNAIQSFQQNRNPFIDNPHWVQLIWGGESANAITFDNFSLSPQVVVASEPVQVGASIESTAGDITISKLFWGLSYNALANEVTMTSAGNDFSGTIPGQAEGQTIYYQILANDGTNESLSVVYNFFVPKTFTGELVSIYDIQGQQDDSPYDGETVSTTGIVTGNFGTSYFIQDGTGLWNGLFIYESGRNPSIGDSVIITGEITEYYGKTEMANITDYYFITANNQLPEAVEVATGEIEEGHESIIISVTDAVCTDENYQSNYFMWEVNDGSGPLKIHNTSIFEYEPTEGLTYDITGPLNYDFDEWKIELRYESDINGSVDLDGPVVISVEPIINTNIKVMFDEEVEESSAENIANYAIDNGITIESASQHAFNKAQVNLTVSSMPFNNYAMIIKDVKDESGNFMEEQEFTFEYVGLDELFVGSVSVYPNPADNQLNISFDAIDATNVEIGIADISGRVIVRNSHTVSMGMNNIELDLSTFTEGIYFLTISQGSSNRNYKIVVK